MSSVPPDIKFNLCLVMSNQNFVLSDQDGVLVGHMSIQEKNIIIATRLVSTISQRFFFFDVPNGYLIFHLPQLFSPLGRQEPGEQK